MPESFRGSGSLQLLMDGTLRIPVNGRVPSVGVPCGPAIRLDHIVTAFRFTTSALLATVLAANAGAQQFIANIPQDPFAPLTGPYSVGSYDWLWVDAQRPEIFTKDPNDKRKLPITVWYPSASGGGGEPALYVRHREEFGPNAPVAALASVRTHATVGAPVAPAPQKLPVVVYSHGAGWPRFTATFVTEELASHGYVVVAIDHPGLDQTRRFSDGTTFQADTLRAPPPDPKQDPLTTAQRSADFLNTVDFPVWVADSRFVLDRIEALDREPGPFRGRLDLDRIGMLGWSFGGAAAIEMLRIDPRVKAAVNHDGRLFGGAMNEPIRRPFMLMHHGGDDTLAAPPAVRPLVRISVGMIRAIDSTARAQATGDWYDVTLARTNHGHFSDLPLFLALFRDPALLDGRRSHEIIAAYTVAFFDRYLKGQRVQLLDGPSTLYPEAAFTRSVPHAPDK